MPNTFPNTTINNLSPHAFIAGSYQTIRFYLYTSACVAIDTTSGSAIGTWSLCHYNQPEYVVLEKTATFNSRYAQVELMSADTEELAGKYIQQFKITGALYYDYIVAQGIVTIVPAIRES